mmetsp:Transcript_9192/g.27836  ORF Transcript_9192/g.27836 Transcript_9192/m.27836 type:complete len:175 (-) Transcript_9192:924-1448(-)
MLLVVLCCAEVLTLRRGDRSVPLDEALHHAAHGLDAKRQRGNVQQKHVRHLRRTATSHDGRLHRGPVGYRLIGVDLLAELLPAKVLGDQLLDLWDARRPPDHDDLGDLRLRHATVLKADSHWFHCCLEVVHVDLLKLCPGKPHAEVNAFMQRVDLKRHLRLRRELPLGALALSA